MNFKRQVILFSAIIFSFIFFISCTSRSNSNDVITVSLSEPLTTLDTLTTTGTSAADERVRTLIYNSLVKKNDNFEYVGDLAKDIKVGDDNVTITFNLQENVKFHNGKVFTAADAKYTFDALLQSNGAKAGSFYDTAIDETDPEKKKTKRVPHIVSIQNIDDKTLVIKVGRPALVNQLLANLVTVPMIPEGTIDQQKTAPIGTGAFKLVSFDQVNSSAQLAAFADYWEGAPNIQKLNVKTVKDANALQAELQSGGVDIAPIPNNLSPDTIESLGKVPNLKVEKFSGSNIDYLGFNVESTPFNNEKIRQAVAYAINREEIIKSLLRDQATLAHSILPEGSWAYTSGTKYNYDVAKAKQLLQESGYKGEVIKFKYASNNFAVNQYSQVIQNALKAIGLNVEIETVDPNVLRDQLKNGQFQMNTGRWIGGNQDPIFFKDLFASSEFPDKKETGRNRARYNNPEFDKIIQEAIDTTDKAKAKDLYAKAQEIISRDLPLFPLWYTANMVIYSKRVGNIKINASGDWSFVKNVTVEK
ncbi:MAG TPA: ABC transporter substrate-binding protein [Pyrinomonadaceae bacterium]|jgi:ABC-type transport system substrate-binding protein